MCGRILFCLCTAMCVLGAPAAGAFTYDDVLSTRWNVNSTWTSSDGGPKYPSGSGDIGNVNSNTVTTFSAGEIPAGVTVNLSAAGTLDLLDTAVEIVPVDPGVTMNIGVGGTLHIRQRSLVACTINLNGGTVQLDHYTGHITAATVNVNSDSVIRGLCSSSGASGFGRASTGNYATVKGSGDLIKTGTGTYGVTVNWTAASTWTGDWDVQEGRLMIDNNGSQYVPGNFRIAAGATVIHTAGYSYYRHDVTGNGQWGVYTTNVVTMASGARFAPGDSGAGKMNIYSTSGGGIQNPMLRLASGSTYEVDILGTADTQYDYFSITGRNAAGDPGVGGAIDIVSGAKLVVNMWTPSAATTLDAVILRTGTGGTLTGTFAPGDITWNNAAGWTLAVTEIDEDLHITGSYQAIAEPSALALLALGLPLLRRRRPR